MSDLSDDIVDLGLPDIIGAQKLSDGGSGTVYRAQQAGVGRSVAVKVLALRPDGDDIARFEAECHALGSLSSHPNILTVYDSGLTGFGRPYLVLELAPGGTIGERIEREGALPWEDAVTIVVKIAGALETAHRSGVLHRDVKPENILVSRFGEPLLGDFGLARFTYADATRTGTLTTSLPHAAPEIIDGRSATAASDVYALGSTLYTLVAGDLAFVRDSDESWTPVVSRIASSPPPDLRPRGVPDEIAAVVEAAMAKDPAERPESVEAFGRALQTAQEHLGMASTRMSLPATPAGEATPPPAEPTVTAPVETPAMAALRYTPSLDPPSRRSDPSPLPSEPSAPRSRRVVLVGVAGAVLSLLAVAAIGVIALTGGEASLRPIESYAVLLAGDSVWVNDPIRGIVKRIEPTDREVVARIPVGSNPTGMGASEDRLWVASYVDSTLTAIDVEKDRVTYTTEVAAFGVAASADAVWVTNRAARGRVTRINPANGKITAVVPVAARPTGITIGPEGSVWVSSRGVVSRIDAKTREVVARIEIPNEVTVSIASNGTAVWIADPETGAVQAIDTTTNTLTPSASVTPSRHLFLAVSGDGSAWVLSTSAEILHVPAGSATAVPGPTKLNVVESGSGIAVGPASVWASFNQASLLGEVEVETNAMSL